MKQDAVLSCACGKVKGVLRGLSAASTNHVWCPCSGCQAYAHFLGRAHDMLDNKGGTNLFQLNPSRVEIHEGMENIACMKVTPRGPLRWYACCCKTPIGNSFPKGGTPFLGVLPIALGMKGTSEELVKLVGPVRGRVNQKPPVPFGERLQSFFMLLRFAFKLLGWRITGGKSWKPFFDAETMDPIREPKRLTDEERNALYEKVI